MTMLLALALFQDDEVEKMEGAYRDCQQLWIDAQIAGASRESFLRFVRKVEDEFAWEFEPYLATYRLFRLVGEAYYKLGDWNKCFSTLGGVSALMRRQEVSEPEVRRIALDARCAEVRCRREYARGLRGVNRAVFEGQTRLLIQEAYRRIPEASAAHFSP